MAQLDGSAGAAPAEEAAKAPAPEKAKAKPAAPAKKKAPAKPAKKAAAPAKKPKAAPAATANPASAQAAAAPASPEPEQPTVDLQASLAASKDKEEQQVDNQADEILDQIRSAAVGIKGIGGEGSAVDEASLQAAVQGMNLVQLDSTIKVKDDHNLPDENAQLAMDYLAQ